MAKSSKPSNPPPPPEKYRRADTGEYTTKKYADKHPNTTVKETDKPKKKS